MTARRTPTDALDAYRSLLWGLSYRMTGSASDADDIVQDTFLRALQSPPRADEAIGRWLIRVATNLGIDALRRRRRQKYAGEWLPAPIESHAGVGVDSIELLPDPADTPAAHYERAESLTFAFVLALEALSPRQRAVLLLRDVFGYSARETADVLSASEANVRVIHHRARRAMRAYDRARRPPTDALQAQTRRALAELIRCLNERDARGLERLLSESVRTVTDGGGEYTALRRPLIGQSKAIVFHLRVARRRGAGARFEPRTINGLPAVVVEFAERHFRGAPRAVLRCELDSAGRIGEVQWILAARKLSAVRPIGARAAAD